MVEWLPPTMLFHQGQLVVRAGDRGQLFPIRVMHVESCADNRIRPTKGGSARPPNCGMLPVVHPAGKSRGVRFRETQPVPPEAFKPQRRHVLPELVPPEVDLASDRFECPPLLGRLPRFEMRRNAPTLRLLRRSTHCRLEYSLPVGRGPCRAFLRTFQLLTHRKSGL